MKTYKEMALEADALKDTEEEIEGLVPVKARVAKDLRSVYSVRLTGGEIAEINDAAKQQGMTVSEFIRVAALSGARGALDFKYGRRAQALLAVRETAEELYRAVQELDVDEEPEEAEEPKKQ